MDSMELELELDPCSKLYSGLCSNQAHRITNDSQSHVFISRKNILKRYYYST